MIKSSEAEVRTLMRALGASDEPRREAAIARLSIIGQRAVGHLIAEYDSSRDRRVQRYLLRALESAADPRALEPAQRALQAGGDLAVAAVGVLRELLLRGPGYVQPAVLDRLLTVADDPSIERRVRAAAAAALREAAGDVGSMVRTEPDAAGPDGALWADALDGRLPENPDTLRDAVGTRAERAPLPALRRLLEEIGHRQQGAAEPDRERWLKLRGALHQAIALRGSRVALDDLRDAFEAATGPLPSSFIAALQTIGDESCLESIATAYQRAAVQHERWRHQLLQAFELVSRRERVTKKHPAMRRALAKMSDRSATIPF